MTLSELPYCIAGIGALPDFISAALKAMVLIEVLSAT
jgi:hypothetical protein